MEAPRLKVESELQPPTYAAATAMRDPSHICNLHHSSWQSQILNPLSEARDRTRILMDTSQICNLLSHNWSSTGLPLSKRSQKRGMNKDVIYLHLSIYLSIYPSIYLSYNGILLIRIIFSHIIILLSHKKMKRCHLQQHGCDRDGVDTGSFKSSNKGPQIMRET